VGPPELQESRRRRPLLAATAGSPEATNPVQRPFARAVSIAVGRSGAAGRGISHPTTPRRTLWRSPAVATDIAQRDEDWGEDLKAFAAGRTFLSRAGTSRTRAGLSWRDRSCLGSWRIPSQATCSWSNRLTGCRV
jgi:hypothetical protein